MKCALSCNVGLMLEVLVLVLWCKYGLDQSLLPLFDHLQLGLDYIFDTILSAQSVLQLFQGSLSVRERWF